MANTATGFIQPWLVLAAQIHSVLGGTDGRPHSNPVCLGCGSTPGFVTEQQGCISRGLLYSDIHKGNRAGVFVGVPTLEQPVDEHNCVIGAPLDQ